MINCDTFLVGFVFGSTFFLVQSILLDRRFKSLSHHNKIDNAEITIYEGGTESLQATYVDKDCKIMSTNPIVLDSEGKAKIWI